MIQKYLPHNQRVLKKCLKEAENNHKFSFIEFDDKIITNAELHAHFEKELKNYEERLERQNRQSQSLIKFKHQVTGFKNIKKNFKKKLKQHQDVFKNKYTRKGKLKRPKSCDPKITKVDEEDMNPLARFLLRQEKIRKSLFIPVKFIVTKRRVRIRRRNMYIFRQLKGWDKIRHYVKYNIWPNHLKSKQKVEKNSSFTFTRDPLMEDLILYQQDNYQRPASLERIISLKQKKKR